MIQVIINFSSLHLVDMNVSDSDFLTNRDWDPCYLRELVSRDFFDFSEHWKSLVTDVDLNIEMDNFERYCPITEDISIDDEVLWTAVEKIEHE